MPERLPPAQGQYNRINLVAKHIYLWYMNNFFYRVPANRLACFQAAACGQRQLPRRNTL
jgi:hypothetical protein